MIGPEELVAVIQWGLKALGGKCMYVLVQHQPCFSVY